MTTLPTSYAIKTCMSRDSRVQTQERGYARHIRFDSLALGCTQTISASRSERSERCTRRGEVPRAYHVCANVFITKLPQNYLPTIHSSHYGTNLVATGWRDSDTLSYDRVGANRDRFIFSHEAHEYERCCAARSSHHHSPLTSLTAT